MAYANQGDVELILPDDDAEVPEEAVDRLAVVLEEATDLVIGYLEREYTGDDTDTDGVPDDVPGAVRRVTARVALRAFTENPDEPGAAATTSLMGPFSHTINWAKTAQDRSVYLSDSDELRLERFKRAFAGSGAAHVPMYDNSYPRPVYPVRYGQVGWYRTS
jgi:hypothetical protein